MANTIVEVGCVSKRFGAIQAVHEVDLTIRRGEVFGLIGHNGAGKSTLFKMMLGLLPATAGTIHVDGELVRGARFRETRRKIGYLPENVVLYDNLSALETLYFFADMKGVARGECSDVLAKVGLSDAAQRRVRDFSKGMRQRLGFAQALLGKPQLLFLDEPTSGLDPLAIRELYQTLRELREQGVTMILTSHILAEIQERVDRLAIMEGGRIRACGTVQQLREAVNSLLTISVSGAADLQQQVAAVLADLAVESIAAAGERVQVRLPVAAKMAALNRLATLGAAVHDLSVHEPTLEDIFFGYGA